MSVPEVKDKVQRILAKNLGSVRIDSDGDFIVEYESAVVFVSVREWGDHALVRIFARVLGDIDLSPELYEWVATEGQDYIFGGSQVVRSSSGTSRLMFDHNLLGDYLDEEELMNALAAVVTTANDLDDELQARFGGERMIEN